MLAKQHIRTKCPYCTREFDIAKAGFYCSKCKTCQAQGGLQSYKRRPEGHFVSAPKRQIPAEILSFSGNRPIITQALRVIEDLWTRAWPRRYVTCNVCNENLAVRVCPKCHNLLPDNVLEANNFVATVLGLSGAGKSHFIVASLHCFIEGLAAELSLDFRPLDDTGEQFRLRYYNWVFEQGKTLPATEELTYDKTSAGIPLIFEISDRAHDFKSNLVLYDLAGGDARNAAKLKAARAANESAGPLHSTDRGADHVVNSDAVLLFIGPRDVNASGGREPPEARIDPQVGEVIDAVRTARYSAGFTHKLPAAVILTKADIYNRAVKLEPRLAQSVRHLPEPNMKQLDETNRLVLDMFAADPEANALIDKIERSFSPVQYFAVSSLGFDPAVGPGGKLTRAPHPHRVEEPLIWLLMQMGFLRAKGRPM